MRVWDPAGVRFITYITHLPGHQQWWNASNLYNTVLKYRFNVYLFYLHFHFLEMCTSAFISGKCCTFYSILAVCNNFGSILDAMVKLNKCYKPTDESGLNWTFLTALSSDVLKHLAYLEIQQMFQISPKISDPSWLCLFFFPEELNHVLRFENYLVSFFIK